MHCQTIIYLILNLQLSQLFLGLHHQTQIPHSGIYKNITIMQKLFITPNKLFLIATAVLFNVQMLYAQLAVTLTASNYNGSNISCFGAHDGTLTANPTGGTPPYYYTWSNSQTTQSISGLAAGYCRIQVKDATGSIVYGEITLIEPEALSLEPVVYTYSNSYNISCWSCSNGVIDIYVYSGTSPYTFLWNDGNTNQSRTNLSPGSHSVSVTDANGCTLNSEQLYLTEPARSDWTTLGNNGSNPPTNFIGTTDNKDLVFKTNNSERLSIKANGQLKITSTANVSTTGLDLLFVDANGILQKAPKPCNQSYIFPWTLGGNYLSGNASTDFIGTCNAYDFVMYANGAEGMRIKTNGNVGIGTTNPDPAYKLSVNGSIRAKKVVVEIGWSDYVFNKDYKLMSIEELDKFVSINNHLPNIPSGKEIEEKGLDIGGVQAKQMEKIEEMTLYIIQLNKKIEAQNKRIAEWEKTGRK